MIKVAGRWELSWNTPIKEAELWNLVLREFNIPDWYMWPITGIQHNESQVIALHERQTFEEILAENQDIAHVFVEPYSPAIPDLVPQDLRTFEHPEDVLYIFGSVGYNPASLFKREQDQLIMVPSIENKGVCWPHQCLFVLLYDRLVKGW